MSNPLGISLSLLVLMPSHELVVVRAHPLRRPCPVQRFTGPY